MEKCLLFRFKKKKGIVLYSIPSLAQYEKVEFDCTVELSFSPDGKLLGICSSETPEGGKGVVWDLDKRKNLYPAGDVVHLEFSPSGKGLLVWTPKGVKQLDLNFETIRSRKDGKVPVGIVARDGRTVCAFDNGMIEVYDLERGEETQRVKEKYLNADPQ